MKFKSAVTWGKYLALLAEDGQLYFVEPIVNGQPIAAPSFTLHSINFNTPQPYPQRPR